MANRKIRKEYWRKSGHKHKQNKKSVTDRKRIKNLLAKWKREGKYNLINEYYQQQQKKAGYGLSKNNTL